MIQPSILVVDDEPNSLFGVCQILIDEGYQVIPAENGKEALERLKTDLINIVITDEKMPDLSGMDLLCEVKRKNQQIPVILITAFGSVSMAVEALKRGPSTSLKSPSLINWSNFLPSSNRPSKPRKWRDRSTISEKKSVKNIPFQISSEITRRCLKSMRLSQRWRRQIKPS